MMCRRTCFNANQTAGEYAEELHDLRSSEPSSQHDRSLSINAVNLENLLRQVEADRANLHLGRFLPSVGDRPITLAHRCRSGAVHPIRSGSAGTEPTTCMPSSNASPSQINPPPTLPLKQTATMAL